MMVYQWFQSDVSAWDRTRSHTILSVEVRVIVEIGPDRRHLGSSRLSWYDGQVSWLGTGRVRHQMSDKWHGRVGEGTTSWPTRDIGALGDTQLRNSALNIENRDRFAACHGLFGRGVTPKNPVTSH